MHLPCAPIRLYDFDVGVSVLSPAKGDTIVIDTSGGGIKGACPFNKCHLMPPHEKKQLLSCIQQRKSAAPNMRLDVEVVLVLVLVFLLVVAFVFVLVLVLLPVLVPTLSLPLQLLTTRCQVLASKMPPC